MYLKTRLRERFPEISPFQPVRAMTESDVTIARVLELGGSGLAGASWLPCDIQLHDTYETLEPHVYQVVVEYSEEELWACLAHGAG